MNSIAVFARRPLLGSVKTRLSPAVPADLALDLYRGMLADAIGVAREAGTDRVVVHWAGEASAESPFDLPAGVEVREQRGADLGERLTAAFAALLVAPGDRAVAIGADCPELTAVTLRSAFALLDGHEVVLGPARDGGYYLIGLGRPVPALFRDVPWGTAGVFAATLARARDEGLRVGELPPLDDLDTPADLVGFVARRCGGDGGAAPATADALRRMGLLPPG